MTRTLLSAVVPLERLRTPTLSGRANLSLRVPEDIKIGPSALHQGGRGVAVSGCLIGPPLRGSQSPNFEIFRKSHRERFGLPERPVEAWSCNGFSRRIFMSPVHFGRKSRLGPNFAMVG